MQQGLAAELAGGGLKRSTLERYTAEAGEAVELIGRNLARAADLIGHFKQAAVDQTSTRRRRFELRQVAEEVLVTLSPRLKRTPFKVELDIPHGIELDSYPGPLEQVLTNLVSNSLDHAFEGRDSGRIRIVAVQAGERVGLVYEDDGCGIPLALRHRVFDPFFTTRLGRGGSGLGLYITYGLVTGRLGGHLAIDDAPGGGARFEIDLPLRAPDSGHDDA
jgi:signal transduction histidine kinase